MHGSMLLMMPVVLMPAILTLLNCLFKLLVGDPAMPPVRCKSMCVQQKLQDTDNHAEEENDEDKTPQPEDFQKAPENIIKLEPKKLAECVPSDTGDAQGDAQKNAGDDQGDTGDAKGGTGVAKGDNVDAAAAEECVGDSASDDEHLGCKRKRAEV